MKQIFISLLFLLGAVALEAQTGSVSGVVTDAETGETLIGATVMIQGTTSGTITDFDGNYLLKNIAPGEYNLIISYISYEKQMIRVTVQAGELTEIDFKLKSLVIGVEEVTVVATRKTDTESAVIATIKGIDIIANGISADQISKSQDSDAAQVIRRVPGITISDGKFVIVRGLMERYNSVLLNGSTAPSFEADKRAFSFDAVPSGMIDNILIYKSPAPELPADFSGAAINIITKSNADQNSLKVGYSTGYRNNTTFSKDFMSYKGGKLDWLGFDDGTRAIPENTPDKDEWDRLYNFYDAEDYLRKTDSITMFSKAFNNIWSAQSSAPFLDQSFSATLQKRFLAGPVSIGNITALSYKNENNHYLYTRNEWQGYDAINDTMKADFNYLDSRSGNKVSTGLIHNWTFIFGKNQKIEFNNFVNNIGQSSTIIREGWDYYDGEELRLVNLRYNQRFIYSGQLAANFRLNEDRTKINVIGGYSRIFNNKPDDRLLMYVKNQANGEYYTELQSVATNVKNGGRLYIALDESIQNLGLNLEHQFSVGGEQLWTVKAGAFYDQKYRDYGTRLLGVVTPTPRKVGVDLYLPADSLFVANNYYFDQTAPYTESGLAYKEGTRPNESYTADEQNIAAYLALKIPVGSRFSVYGGLRMEHYSRNLYSGISSYSGKTDTLAVISRDTLNFFPSVNMVYRISDKHQLKASYGLTTNRPEFREISPTDYEDFDLNVIIHGNSDLKDAYIHNYDLRYEWYPNLGEMVSLAAFYKHFINPIEMFLFPSGTGYDYIPFNTETAYSAGLELDVRKSFTEFEGREGLLSYLKNVTVIFNTSLIKSEINTDMDFARDSVRVMQGQSPYIVNLAAYYKSPEKGWMLSLNYNRIGKHIALVGSPSNPHTWELPRNSLDLTVAKDFGRVQLNAGLKNILNSPIQYVQYYGDNEEIVSTTRYYRENFKVMAGFAVKL